MKEKIIIVGGGASGLLSARLLANEYEVLVIEAREEAGGRIRSVQPDGFTGIIEAGPEFIHGRLPITLSLLREAGIQYYPVEGKMYRVSSGVWKKDHGSFKEWDQVLSKMDEWVDDTTLERFLHEAFPGKDEIHDQIRRYAEGFDLADPSDASMKALYREWSAEDEVNYRIPGGYQQLMRYLQQQAKEAGATFLFNDAVTTVRWDDSKVMVKTNSRMHHADRVIISIPFPLFTDPLNQIVAIEKLPIAYRDSFKEIGKGTVIKVLVEFSECLWKKDAGFIFSDQKIPTWWTCLPDTRPLLTGWLGGPAARRYAASNDEDITRDAIESLCNILQLSEERIKQAVMGIKIYNWNRIPESAMAYSYGTPESAAARALLAQPIDNKIYFAGEACYGGESPGTVEAAFASAIAVSQRLKES